MFVLSSSINGSDKGIYSICSSKHLGKITNVIKNQSTVSMENVTDCHNLDAETDASTDFSFNECQNKIQNNNYEQEAKY